jgi:methylated-DNA-[protein]-cysteine S-methyltransferase
MQLQIESLPSPIGTIVLVSGPQGLCAVEFGERRKRLEAQLRERFGDIELVSPAKPTKSFRAMQRYLGGEVGALDDLPVDTGGTPFQQKVWKALRAVRAGRTATYGEIAVRIGAPGAARAVGLANGQNPIPLAVPCHRIIGANGTLTGYGGGLDRKLWLLQHEGASLL